jgi:hypothetical protein
MQAGVSARRPDNPTKSRREGVARSNLKSSLALLGTRLRSLPACSRHALPHNNIMTQSPGGGEVFGGFILKFLEENSQILVLESNPPKS